MGPSVAGVRSTLRRVVRSGRRRLVAAGAALLGRPAPPVPARDDREAGESDAWWDLLPFTTHRIELVPGVATMEGGVDIAADVRVDLVIDACEGSLAGRRVVDLGCLEGGFTLAFAQRGAAEAVGIEARPISVRRCELARTFLGLDNARFVEADIKDELAGATYDVVFAAGIIYHVADPLALLTAMRRACTRVALIDTHVAHPAEVSHHCSPVVARTFGERQWRGRMFPEYAPDVSAGEHRELLWAAWSDTDSFWPLESELVDMIHHAGFTGVEKVDLVADGRAERWHVDQLHRVVYLAWV
jgi:SAM-dependent methyltransferase